MSSAKASQTNAVKHFWDRYIHYLIDSDIKSSVARWYVIRAEQYIKFFPDKRLADQSPQDVVCYLEGQSRNANLEDWQFCQIVNAIQKLFAMLEVSWLDEVDWQHWQHSVSLSGAHPTIAREASVDETILKLANTGSRLAEVRRLHGDALKQMMMAIRQRGYSIRTEQAYESWVARFIAFCDNRDPRKLGPDEVVSFLQHLAVRRNVAAST